MSEILDWTSKKQETKMLAVIGKLMESMVNDITLVSYKIDERPVHLKLRTKDGGSYVLLLINDDNEI